MRLIFCLGLFKIGIAYLLPVKLSRRTFLLLPVKSVHSLETKLHSSRRRAATTSFDRFGICSLARFPWLSVDRSILTLNRTDQSFPCARYDGYNTGDEVTVLIQRAILPFLSRIFFFSKLTGKSRLLPFKKKSLAICFLVKFSFKFLSLI